MPNKDIWYQTGVSYPSVTHSMRVGEALVGLLSPPEKILERRLVILAIRTYTNEHKHVHLVGQMYGYLYSDSTKGYGFMNECLLGPIHFCEHDVNEVIGNRVELQFGRDRG